MAPAFYTQPLSQTFFCTVAHQPHQDQPSDLYIEAIPHLYSVGQQEPLKEVINPYSRTYYYYMKQKVQTYIALFMKENKCVTFQDVNLFFPQFAE